MSPRRAMNSDTLCKLRVSHVPYIRTIHIYNDVIIFIIKFISQHNKVKQNHNNRKRYRQAGSRHGSLASMSLCKHRSSANLLKLTRTSVKLTGKLVCDVARLVSIMIIRDDVISDVIRPRSTIREDHIETPYREIVC